MNQAYEKILKQKRGYVTKWPENKAAIFMISGGMDSTITAARLMGERQIELFPLHIDRGQTNKEAEWKAVAKFTLFFRRKFPNLFNPPENIRACVPPKEIKGDLKGYMKKYGYPLRDPILQFYAVQYGVALNQKRISPVKTIFCALVDGDPFPHTNLTCLRAINVAICQALNDWEWQITSPNIDPFLTNEIFNKQREIKWAMSNNFPIEATLSCYKANKETRFKNCGRCVACLRRVKAFKTTGYKDPTKYFYK